MIRQRLIYRADDAERAAIRDRANAEHGGNRSELLRRLVAYGLLHMPRGWGAKGEEP